LVILFLAVLCVSLGSQTAAADIYEVVELGGLYHAHASGFLVFYDGEYLRKLWGEGAEVFAVIKSTGRKMQ